MSSPTEEFQATVDGIPVHVDVLDGPDDELYMDDFIQAAEKPTMRQDLARFGRMAVALGLLTVGVMIVVKAVRKEIFAKDTRMSRPRQKIGYKKPAKRKRGNSKGSPAK